MTQTLDDPASLPACRREFDFAGHHVVPDSGTAVCGRANRPHVEDRAPTEVVSARVLDAAHVGVRADLGGAALHDTSLLAFARGAGPLRHLRKIATDRSRHTSDSTSGHRSARPRSPTGCRSAAGGGDRCWVRQVAVSPQEGRKGQHEQGDVGHFSTPMARAVSTALVAGSPPPTRSNSGENTW